MFIMFNSHTGWLLTIINKISPYIYNIMRCNFVCDANREYIIGGLVGAILTTTNASATLYRFTLLHKSY